MSTRYIPGHIIDEARDLRRQGVPVTTLAERLRVSPETLTRLLEIPAGRPVPQDDTDGGCDLWSADRLDSQL